MGLFKVNSRYCSIVVATIQAGVQSYFAINQAQDVISSKQHGNVLKSPFMAYGSFATYIHPNQRYGIIFGGSFKGMMMDIDQLMYQAVSKDNDSNELKGFIQSQGARQSANEHLVPEQLFDDPNTKEKEVEGVSAVKALQLASQQGQTIYTITKDNFSQVLPKLSLSSNVISDIRHAIHAGKQVTVHEKNINHQGWNGSGYIILDPTNGTGAYLIDGGANGGILYMLSDNSMALSLLIALLGLFAPLAGVGYVTFGAPLLLLSTILILTLTTLLWMVSDLSLQESNCPNELRMLNASLTVAFTIFGFRANEGREIWVALLGWMMTSGTTANSIKQYCINH